MPNRPRFLLQTKQTLCGAGLLLVLLLGLTALRQPSLPVAPPPLQAASLLPPDTLDLSKIHGNIQFVESFPDYKVKVVNSFPDLKVQLVEHFPDAPGKWKIVEHFPDFKIQLVDNFPDFTIQYVDNFPGVQKTP